jgi:hypothetical protein
MRRPTDVSDACFSEIRLGGNQDADGHPGYQRMRSQPHPHFNSCTDGYTAANQHANSCTDGHTAANQHSNSCTDEHTAANQHANSCTDGHTAAN